MTVAMRSKSPPGRQAEAIATGKVSASATTCPRSSSSMVIGSRAASSSVKDRPVTSDAPRSPPAAFDSHSHRRSGAGRSRLREAMKAAI